MKISKLNGLFYIDSPYQYAWCDNDGYKQWFPLNTITRAHFKKDILPYIKNNKCEISKKDYDEIRLFSQNKAYSTPVLAYLEPKGITLMEHQKTAVELMFQYHKYGFFLGTGTGKTLIAITYLLNKQPSSCLIVTPQKVVGQYKEELDKYIPNNNYLVTNFEQLPHHIDEDFDCIIIDESHRAKNYMSNINYNLRTLASKATDVFLFTGTPQDKARYDILSQLAILDERVMPVKTKIINRYFILDDYYNPSKEKLERSDELTYIIKQYTWGKKTDEVITLTKEHNFIVHCEHPKQFYDELAKERILEQGSWYCVADNKGVLRIALREIASGFVNWKQDLYDKEGNFISHNEETELLKFNPKTEPFTTLIKAIDSCIIYYEFTNNLKDIEAVLKNLNKSYVIVNGSTSKKKSTELINKFKQGQVKYLVIQSRSGNAGLDLTNVHDVIFYNLPESYIVFHQCKSRIRRQGQTKECNYFYLIDKDTIEEAVYKSLARKKSFTEKVFKQYIK